MTEQITNIFHESFSRCSIRNGFFQRFYEIFVNSSDEVKEKFVDTDMQEQIKMVSTSFFTSKLPLDEAPFIKENLHKLAVLHGRHNLDIRPELYDQWLECLIQVVSEFDHEYTQEIESAWRQVMLPGIEYMKSHYDN